MRLERVLKRVAASGTCTFWASRGTTRLKQDGAVDGPLTPSHPPMESLSLSTVFRRALLNLSKASNLPTIQDETQVVRDLFHDK